jgi:hypothetical protein
VKITLFAPHHPKEGHLATVRNDMLQLGPPTIRAYYCELRKVYLAVEGSHRIKAAIDLGHKIRIQKVEITDEITPNRQAFEVLDKWRWAAHGAKYFVDVEFL